MSRTSFRVNLHSIVSLNLKELFAWSRPHIWGLSASNKIQTHNHLVLKGTLNHLTKRSKWLSCVVSTYLYGAFVCMLFSCHIRVSDWMWVPVSFAKFLRTPFLRNFRKKRCLRVFPILLIISTIADFDYYSHEYYHYYYSHFYHC